MKTDATAPSATPLDPQTLALITRLSADLQRKAGELDAILNVLPIGIGIADDPECRHIRVNRAFAAQLGIEPNQNASMSAPEGERPQFRLERDGRVIPTDELPMQYATAHGVEVHNAEIDVVHPDGRRVTLYEWAVPLFDESGAVRGAIGVFMDISERRRVEEEQRFLAEASRVLSSTLDYDETLGALARLTVPLLGEYCAIDVLQEDGTFARIVYVVDDPAKRAIADGLRRYPPVLTLDSPGARVMKTGEPIVATDCPPEILASAAQNDEHLQLLTAMDTRGYMIVPLRARGRKLGLLTIGCCSDRFRYDERSLRLATDVAARASLALDNALLYRNARDADRLKEEFLATLSHELRTPLNALLGWTQMLRMRRLDEATTQRALESIERNAGAQASLINDLLDVSRAVSGKLRIEMRPVDLHAVVLSAIDAINPAVRAREIDLTISMSPINGEVLGDPDRLRQVVWNLLSNAVKFAPAQGRVEIGIEQCELFVQVSVTDNGSGIDAAFLPYVVERFRQGDSTTTRAHGGLGLGLAIVRHLVDLHGGSVTVRSAGTGQGSRFTVSLPIQPPARPSELPEPSVDAARDALRGIRVLAVDDDRDSRELLQLALRGAGADVLVLDDGQRALEALPTYAPHVVVADIAMPDLDGFELMRRIAATPKAPPVVALSAYVGPEDIKRTRDAGFALHLRKPTDFDRLIRAIAELAPRL
jgi:PAS domain S-box-containing protein